MCGQVCASVCLCELGNTVCVEVTKASGGSENVAQIAVNAIKSMGESVKCLIYCQTFETPLFL